MRGIDIANFAGLDIFTPLYLAKPTRTAGKPPLSDVLTWRRIEAVLMEARASC